MSVHVIGVHVIGVPLIDVPLTDVPLIGVHLMTYLSQAYLSWATNPHCWYRWYRCKKGKKSVHDALAKGTYRIEINASFQPHVSGHL
jgi:hypothetical protein